MASSVPQNNSSTSVEPQTGESNLDPIAKAMAESSRRDQPDPGSGPTRQDAPSSEDATGSAKPDYHSIDPKTGKPVEGIAPGENTSERLGSTPVQAPVSEAMSHKPTYGLAAELPEIMEPNGDPTLPGSEDDLPPAVEIQEVLNQLNPPKANIHRDDVDFDYTGPDHISQEAIDALNKKLRGQEISSRINPDGAQRDSHQPSTEGLLKAPVTRPHTVDPATGHVIFAGEARSLPGGTVAHEAETE